ncbi:MAG TPA: dihydroorotate dehydrogenase [Acidimicrobiales bacterium]|nr:dihydroorotate dehydrogenase [Acidimicrobiales bacterium]
MGRSLPRRPLAAGVPRRRPATPSGVDLRAHVGSVALSSPVMTAAGTAGHGAELARYFPLDSIGAVVVKSLSAAPHAGNPAPRVHETAGGMLNSVGLQNPGVEEWLAHDLPALEAAGATVVASIWGTTVEEFAKAAAMLAPAAVRIVAVEVNVSCPNTEDRRRMFAHSPSATAEAIDAAGAAGVPRWAKLSPNVTDLTPIAAAAIDAGAEALTLTNTLMGMAVDPATRGFRLGSGPNGGGLSGPALHPVAVRAVFECRAAFPDIGIIGVGGVMTGADAAEFLAAGADAVQVGTATFLDPRAPSRVARELQRWCRRHDVSRLDQLIGGAHVH